MIEKALETLVATLLLAVWVAGWVLAKGFWSTLAAVVLAPFWSAYLVMERLLQAIGWV